MDIAAEYMKISAAQPGVDTDGFYSTCMALTSRGDISWEIVGSIGAKCFEHPELDCRVMGRALLEQGALRRDSTCLTNLATSLIRGDGGARDEARAAQILMALCETAGLARRQRSLVLAMLGESHRLGRGVPQSDARALVYYEAAAELDNVAAIHHAALLHECGAPPDFSAAAAHYERILALHPDALTHLGRLHVAGLLADADPVRGVALLRQAADGHGDLQAQVLLRLARADRHEGAGTRS